jgi:hypothetical protein
MYHYNFTNDLRISTLDSSIQEAAQCIMNGTVPLATTDKSKNNNILTLKFYFNLNENSVCAKYAANGHIRNVVLNTIKKFQFPNSRTNTDLLAYQENEQVLAPMREIVKILFLLTNFTSEEAYLTSEEIRYFIFYNENIAKRKNYDLMSLIQQIKTYRQNNVLPASIEVVNINTYWKQEERQLREMLRLLVWSDYIVERNGRFIINEINLSQKDKADLFEITNYNGFWNPHSGIDYQDYMDMEDDININKDIVNKAYMKTINSLQQIFYGAPGTGKSYYVKKQTNKDNSIRTTFHPDSDYASFVGAYKPTEEDRARYGLNQKETVRLKNEDGEPLKEKVITYKFVPQVFLKAYVEAWKRMAEAKKDGKAPEPYYLVIEEINRGNCAQIFGDLFQLLDRNGSGFSSYSISPDTDIQKFIAQKDESGFGDDFLVDDVCDEDNEKVIATCEDIKTGQLMVLPPNLYIWATMNTSDQSLFPIDSAFKRRWEWKYMPIKYNKTDWKIEIGNKKYNWVDFQKEINKRVYSVDNSEDKQLGDYFVNARDGVITADTLLNKILFYLWNDVCKDGEGDIFKIKDNGNVVTDIKFSEFFEDDKENKLQELMAFLGVKAEGESGETEVEPESSDDNNNKEE